MNSGDYLGFVEGWTFSAKYNQISISMILSPIAFSLQAMRWNDVPIVEAMEHNQSNFGLDQCHDCGVRRKHEQSNEQFQLANAHGHRFGHGFASRF
jgi:hypothetical protein